MSTYLDNTPTYLPTVQPYEPNYQLYAGTLEFKQTQYDTAHKKLSNLYSSLLNSPMLRDGNNKTRDEFFKSINYEIKKIGEIDLSLQENVHQATQVFTSLYDDKNIVKDMMWTKNYLDQKKRGDRFRNCFDPDKCGGEFWEEGLAELDYRAEEFRNASDEEAMNFGDIRYTPYINVQKEALKLFKEYGLEPPSISEITGDGYIITTTGGPELMGGPLLQLFSNTFQNDPRMAAMYRTQAYVERKSWVKANAVNYGGSEEAATQAWIQEKQTAIQAMFNQMGEDLDFENEVQDNQRNELEERIKNEGTTGDDDLTAAYLRTLERNAQIESTNQIIDNTLSTSSKVSDSRSINMAAESIDGAYASLLLNGDITRAALTISQFGYKREIKGDPTYAARLAAQNKKDEEDEIMDFWNQGEAFTEYEPQAGGVIADTSPDAAAKALEEMLQETEQETRLVNEAINSDFYEATWSDAQNSNSGSTNDLLKQTGELLQVYADWAERSGSAGDKRDAAKQLERWSKKSKREKASWAKGENSFKYILGKLDEGSHNKLYKKAFKPMINQAMSGDATKDYLKPHIVTNQNNILWLDNEKLMLSTERQLQGAINLAALNKTLATLDEDNPMSQYMPYLLNQDGTVRNANSFATNYAFENTPNSGSTFIEDPNALQRTLDRFFPAAPGEEEEVVMVAGPMRGKTVKRSEAPVWTKTKEGEEKYLYPTSARGHLTEMFRATAEAQKQNTPKVTINDNGKEKEVFVGDFFDDDGFIAEEYDRFSQDFEFANDNASKNFESKFREAKWAYRFGDKSDAWNKNEDGTFSPSPFKERTTSFGRGMRNLLTGGPMAMWEGVFGTYDQGMPTSGEVFLGAEAGTKSYYENYTDYNAEMDSDNTYYGANWKNQGWSALEDELRRSVGDVDVDGQRVSVLTSLGSFAAKPIGGELDFGSGKTRVNGAFLEYYRASMSNGVGLADGMSWTYFGDNPEVDEDGNPLDNANHDAEAFEILQTLYSAAKGKDAKDKSYIKLKYKYSSLGADNKDMQAMTVIPIIDSKSEPLIEDLAFKLSDGAKKDSDEYMDAYKKITNGITLFQPDAVAKTVSGGHTLYKSMKMQRLEQIMDVTKELTVPGSEDVANIKVVKDGNKYVIKGSLQTGYNHDDQTKINHAIPNNMLVFDAETDLQYIYDAAPFQMNGVIYYGLNNFIDKHRERLKEAGAYESSNRIYDPSYISDQWRERLTTAPQERRDKELERPGKRHANPWLNEDLGPEVGLM